MFKSHYLTTIPKISICHSWRFMETLGFSSKYYTTLSVFWILKGKRRTNFISKHVMLSQPNKFVPEKRYIFLSCTLKTRGLMGKVRLRAGHSKP